ncbi:hypothetical protein N9V30_03935 [Candidatus Poseidoniales archaeon]|nr:hypothetical protein [Candidatus Poseidoniales archaeon]
MATPKVWKVIPALAISPKKAFFGLDKNSAHCFTIDQRLHSFFDDPEIGGRWGIGPYNKQIRVNFEILGEIYPAELRLSVQNRTKTRLHAPDDLPKRRVYQFQWKKFEQTIVAIKSVFNEICNEVSEGNVNHSFRIVFYHLGNDIFMLRPSKDGMEYDETMIPRHDY